MSATKSIPRESSVVQTILRKLNSIRGCKAVKKHGETYGSSGEPDINGSFRGRRFDLEAKRPDPSAKPTDRQLRKLEEWKGAGSIAGVVRSWGDVVGLFRNHGIDIQTELEKSKEAQE